jgi:siroheme synthase (precorrin-2 oxidase/ferrochelatase)
MLKENQLVTICLCSSIPKEATKIIETEIALLGKVIRTIERKYLPKNMKHADVVILAQMDVPCLLLPRLAEMAKLMGKLNNRIDESAFCWYT